MSILICCDGSPSARRAEEVADNLSSEPIGGGTHGRTMQADLLGSDPNALAHHPRLPVSIVPSRPRNPE